MQQPSMAMTQNVRRFMAAVHELSERPQGVEGMGLLWGEPGEGKSTTVAYVTNKSNGVFVRATSVWTVTSMLAALCGELRLPAHRQRAPMMKGLVLALADSQRPVFVDEADYLVRQPVMIDALRDLYDAAKVPVVLIGMEDMASKVQAIPKCARRITQWIEFSGITQADARLVAQTCCEAALADELLLHLHSQARGNIGRMVTALARIQALARTNGLATVTLADWGDRSLFYDQPQFSRRPR